MEELQNMFWGLVVTPGKRFETEVQEAFRITKACLVPSTADGKVSTLFIETKNSEEFILSNLSLKNFNETLDISFNEGEKICFRVSGPGTVHLTGNLLEPENTDSDSDYEEGDSEEEMVDELKKLKWTEQQIKQLQNNQDDSESDDESEEEDRAESEEEESKEEESKEEEIPDQKQVLPVTTKTMTVIKQANTSNGVINQQTAVSKTSNEKTNNKDTQISETAPKKVVKNGIIIEDLVKGSGEGCKNGNGVGMFYTGRLKTKKKAFDSCQSGKPFRFKMGAGKVIKGWDIGLLGIKVGGKRRLTIPSAMGYGKRGAPPDIPPNSTLVFDVECKFIYGGQQY